MRQNEDLLLFDSFKSGNFTQFRNTLFENCKEAIHLRKILYCSHSITDMALKNIMRKAERPVVSYDREKNRC